jgi:putative transposase
MTTACRDIDLPGLAPADVKRLKALETETARLKKLLAERDLDVEVLKDINRRKW